MNSLLITALKNIIGSIDQVEDKLKKAIPGQLNELIEMIVNDYIVDVDDDELESLSEGYKEVKDLDLDSSKDLRYLSEKYLYKSAFPAAMNRLKENIQWQNNKIKVWRVVMLQSINDLNENLGVHWTYSKDFADAYDYADEAGAGAEEYLLEALAPIESINYPSFINHIISHWAETEREITLQENQYVYDVKVLKDGNLIKEFDKQKI